MVDLRRGDEMGLFIGTSCLRSEILVIVEGRPSHTICSSITYCSESSVLAIACCAFGPRESRKSWGAGVGWGMVTASWSPHGIQPRHSWKNLGHHSLLVGVAGSVSQLRSG